jgi:diguanylate cyclase (GGDEF)-like protein
MRELTHFSVCAQPLMPPSRAPSTSPLSSRVFWLITLVFCAIEVGILIQAYWRDQEQNHLAGQVALVHQGTAITWHMAADPIQPDPRHRWLDSVLRALRGGGTVLTLENTQVYLPPVEGAEARQALTEILARWGSFTRLETLGPNSQAANNELRALAPAMTELSSLLTRQRDDAAQAATTLMTLALATSLAGFVAIGTLLLRHTRQSERSGRLLRSMMNQIGAGVCILGSTDKIADANRAACRMLGRPRKSLRGKRLDEILTENDGVWTGERPDGMPIAVERIPGTIEGYKGPLRIMTLLDVTARHLTAECLQHLAHHDSLTGLPNRSFLENHFRKELSLSQETGTILGVAVIDLDGFKPVNDTYGHAVGDALLVQIGQRLGTALRISDVIARTGGDEFVGVFPDVNNRDSLSFLGERLLGVFAHPFEIREHTITMSGSIGLAIAPDDGADQDSLLRAADAAMYRAKQAGKRGMQLSAVDTRGRAA